MQGEIPLMGTEGVYGADYFRLKLGFKISYFPRDDLVRLTIENEFGRDGGEFVTEKFEFMQFVNWLDELPETPIEFSLDTMIKAVKDKNVFTTKVKENHRDKYVEMIEELLNAFKSQSLDANFFIRNDLYTFARQLVYEKHIN